jgi:hypothetical protein
MLVGLCIYGSFGFWHSKLGNQYDAPHFLGDSGDSMEFLESDNIDFEMQDVSLVKK